jgi:glutathione synthase/RimK-type ligase-like ATP-grasp enzyme
VPRLQNPPAALRWSSDKRYLNDLAGRGCDVIPTVWNPDHAGELPVADEWVVKPAISAGSRNTARWATRDEVLEHVRGLRAAGATAMVQPYVASVDYQGETALLFIGGRFSHAVRKGPLLLPDEGVRQDRNSRGDLRVVNATTEQLALARTVLAAATAQLALTAPLLYARVDVVAGDRGPLLLELELIEPSLFLPQDPAAPQRLVGAVAQLRS